MRPAELKKIMRRFPSSNDLYSSRQPESLRRILRSQNDFAELRPVLERSVSVRRLFKWQYSIHYGFEPAVFKETHHFEELDLAPHVRAVQAYLSREQVSEIKVALVARSRAASHQSAAP